MTLTPARRVFNALVAVVFLFPGAAELSSVRPCPHHESLATVGAKGHTEHQPADAGHVEHQEHAYSDSGAGEDSCTCKRVCPGLTATPLAIPVSPALAHKLEQSRSVVLQGGDAPYPRLIPFFLPYGLAPPYFG